jgi:hypothetical protein
MPKNALKIDADSESEWFGWPQKKVLSNGETVRPLTGGESRVLEIDGNRAQKSFVAIQFAEDLSPGDVKNIRAKYDGQTIGAFFNPVFPRFALFCPTTLADGNAYGLIRFELEYSVGQCNTLKPTLQISTVYYLPARGMFSKQWASRQRQAVAKKAGGKPEWSPEDFPYSHFDGMAYMLNNELVRKSIQEVEFESSIEYFLKNESHLKTSLILAVDTSPQPGNLSNILGHALQVPDLKKTILNQKNELCRTQDQLNLERAKSRLEINQTSAQKRNIEEENKLLLKQLHSVQEELEKVFIESENFKSLKKDLEASKAQAAETEKGRADLAAQLEACTKERDTLGNQRDQLKQTAGERASRIAELEAQVADQAERQKLIDEQMVRAESQLEMLKQFLQPAFQ